MSLIIPASASTATPSFGVLGKQELQERRQNGAYYTPDLAAQILTRWAIRRPNDIVLEPSFGGCGFLIATRDRLLELGNGHPQDSLYGCDIDDKAFKFLGKLLGEVEQSHFKQTDFLTVNPTEFPAADVAIGNPPYISMHNMQPAQKAAARAVIANEQDSMDGRASLWMYFVLHSLAFLKPAGRVAWILPGSFVYSDYSAKIRAKLEASFERCLAIMLEDRIFLSEGTEESSVVLLCEGYNISGKNRISLTSVKGLSELEGAIEQWSLGAPVGNAWSERPQLALATTHAKEIYERYLARATTHRLGKFADIKIGIVTGANKFFVLSSKQAQEFNLSEKLLTPILARFTQARGLQLSEADLQETIESGGRCLLVDTYKYVDIPVEISDYLLTFPADEKAKNNTFTRRSVWHQPNDGRLPSGFFSSMQTEGPVLVLNESKSTCTNTVYRVFFQPEFLLQARKLIAISIQSTFSQFSAEVEGRSYGHGALKIEPSEAKRIALLLPKKLQADNVEIVFSTIDMALRAGDRKKARKIADDFLLAQELTTIEEVRNLEIGLQRLRHARNGYRKELLV